MKCSPCPDPNETKCGEPINGECKYDSDCCTGRCDNATQVFHCVESVESSKFFSHTQSVHKT